MRNNLISNIGSLAGINGLIFYLIDGFSPHWHQQTRTHEIFITTRAQFVSGTGNIFC